MLQRAIDISACEAEQTSRMEKSLSHKDQLDLLVLLEDAEITLNSLDYSTKEKAAVSEKNRKNWVKVLRDRRREYAAMLMPD